jgi:predicted aldo/keto reductase-like oxidoreductase
MKKLGFGMMRLAKLPGGGEKDIDKAQVADMIDLYLERGFNYFDTAYFYHGGESEKVARELLIERYPRESFQFATKMPVWEMKSKDDCEKVFQDQLKRTGAKYFDNYLIHGLNRGNIKTIDEYGLWEYLKSLKERGLARQIGFSSHTTAEHLEQLFEAHPEVEFVQIQLNYADWESKDVQSRLCYETAVKYSKKIFVMEPVRGGALTALPPEVREIFFKAAPERNLASWALRFAASFPKVDIVLSGMSEMKQLVENMDTFDDFEPLTEKELGVIAKVMEELSKVPTIPCTACKYCVNNCPEKINIPAIIKLYNDFKTFRNLDANIRRYEFATANSGKASSCVKCGECERRCPQNIPIIETLSKIASAFE